MFLFFITTDKGDIILTAKIITYLILGLFIASVIAINFLGYVWYHIILLDIGLLLLLALLFRVAILSMYANVAYISGKEDAARKYLKMAIDKKTKNSATYLNYAIVLVREGKAKESIEYLEIAEKINKNPINEKNIKLTMASSYWVSGDIDKAIEILETMRKKYDYVNAHVLTTLGYMYLLKENLDEALSCTNKAIEDAPQSGAAWDNLGQIYYMQENFEEAKTSFEKAVSYKSTLPDSLYYLGKIALNEENQESAKNYFAKALDCEITSLNTVTREQIEAELAAI